MSHTATAPAPESPANRTVGGVLVHLLALPLGLFGAGLVYLLASHPFTRANARHALNWHLSVVLVTVLGGLAFLLGADTVRVAGAVVGSAAILPPPFDTVFAMTGWLLLFVAMVGWFMTAIFAVIATAKASFGTAWSYPAAFELVR
jgi:uncharacterized Tic20 family protein